MGAPFAADVNLVGGNEAGAGETRVSQLEAVDAGGVSALVYRVAEWSGDLLCVVRCAVPIGSQELRVRL